MRRVAYKELRDIVKSEGGTMEYHSGGAGGSGTWEIQFRGKYARIRNTQLNPLDYLYLPKPSDKRANDPPAEWKDFSTQLADDADSRLEEIVRCNAG